MSNILPPAPIDAQFGAYNWVDWYEKVRRAINQAASVITVIQGGTGITSYAIGDLLYASASNLLARRAIGTTGQFLQVVGGLPAWSTLLGVANGGTGTASPALVAGTNVTITGTWPNQTINATGGGGGITALTGDVTASGTGSVAATIAALAVTTGKIAAAAVTYAKIQNVSANSRLLGSGSAGSGAAPSEITLAGGLTMSGTTLTGGYGASFSAYAATTVTPTNNIEVTVSIDTVQFDTASAFNTTTHIWTPPAGKYHIIGTVDITNTVQTCYVRIYKNASIAAANGLFGTPAAGSPTEITILTAIDVIANGTDTFALKVTASASGLGTTYSITGSPTVTRFSGHQIGT